MNAFTRGPWTAEHNSMELGRTKAHLRASGCVLFVDVDGVRVRIDVEPAVRAALRLAGVGGA